MSVVTEHVPMRDGVSLVTDVYLPEGSGDGAAPAGPWPVLIIRTPYRRRGLAPFRSVCARGYALIIQDVRGTGDSEGTFRLLAQEPADALDTADWLLKQSWCDGRFGIVGISYLSAASLAIAAEFPERVKACVWVTLPLKREWLSYRGGALRLHHGLPWSMLVAGRTLGGHDWPSLYATAPLRAAAPDMPFWQVLCDSEVEASPLWRENDLSAYLERVRAPGLHFAGWYDFLSDASFAPFAQLVASSGAPQRLIVGPYSHNGIVSDTNGCGDIHYGDVARPRFAEQTVAWFDHWFKGSPLAQETGVRAFLTGDGGHWIDLPSWGDGDLRELFLTQDRRLQLAAPAAAKSTFVHDPLRPVPTQGGAVWEFPGAHVGLEPGPTVQTTAGRDDVLVFDTDALSEPLIICGPATLYLQVETTAVSADLAAKLCDVAPDGVSRYVADGITRAGFTPGEARDVVVGMDCGHSFAAGHRLRLELAGSNFPKYDRNPGTGQGSLNAGPEQFRPYRQTVLFGASRLTLTVPRA
ncbi:MAG: CocE/NonD family hydrolase [Chloroflexota bacterium]